MRLEGGDLIMAVFLALLYMIGGFACLIESKQKHSFFPWFLGVLYLGLGGLLLGLLLADWLGYI